MVALSGMKRGRAVVYLVLAEFEKLLGLSDAICIIVGGGRVLYV